MTNYEQWALNDLERDPASQLTSSELYASYCAWAQWNNKYIYSHKAVVQDLQRAGGIKRRGANGRRYVIGFRFRAGI